MKGKPDTIKTCDINVNKRVCVFAECNTFLAKNRKVCCCIHNAVYIHELSETPQQVSPVACLITPGFW